VPRHSSTRRFTFSQLVARTPGRSSSERLAILWCLPELLVRQAFADLAERMRDRARHDFELSVRDGS